MLCLLLTFQVYVVVGIAGVALTGCVLMVIILKYGRNSKFGIKGELMLLHDALSDVKGAFYHVLCGCSVRPDGGCDEFKPCIPQCVLQGQRQLSFSFL